MGRCREICKKIKKKIVVEKKIPVEFPVIQGRLLVGKVAMIVGGIGGIGYAIAPGSIATPMLGIVMKSVKERKPT